MSESGRDVDGSRERVSRDAGPSKSPRLHLETAEETLARDRNMRESFACDRGVSSEHSLEFVAKYTETVRETETLDECETKREYSRETKARLSSLRTTRTSRSPWPASRRACTCSSPNRPSRRSSSTTRDHGPRLNRERAPSTEVRARARCVGGKAISLSLSLCRARVRTLLCTQFASRERERPFQPRRNSRKTRARVSERLRERERVALALSLGLFPGPIQTLGGCGKNPVRRARECVETTSW